MQPAPLWAPDLMKCERFADERAVDAAAAAVAETASSRTAASMWSGVRMRNSHMRGDLARPGTAISTSTTAW